MEEIELTKIYEEDKHLLKDEGSFLKWINKHLSCILYVLDQDALPRKEREMLSGDLYKIQKVIFRRIKKYYDKKRKKRN